jgi:hypothetical protein
MAILKIHFNFNNNHDVNKVINECLKNLKYIMNISKIVSIHVNVIVNGM